jgi:hypothetical protein
MSKNSILCESTDWWTSLSLIIKRQNFYQIFGLVWPLTFTLFLTTESWLLQLTHDDNSKSEYNQTNKSTPTALLSQVVDEVEAGAQRGHRRRDLARQVEEGSRAAGLSLAWSQSGWRSRRWSTTTRRLVSGAVAVRVAQPTVEHDAEEAASRAICGGLRHARLRKMAHCHGHTWSRRGQC